MGYGGIKIRLYVSFLGLFLASCSAGVLETSALCNSSQKLSWEKALETLKVCEVESIVQTHSLAVNIFLKNDVVISTQEPRIDEIFRVIRRCGKRCDHIGLITE